MGFKFAQIGLILTRKILLGIALSILITVIMVFKIKTLTHPHSYEKITYFQDNWETFLDKCSANKMSLHSAFCVEKYLDRSAMNWEGYVIRLIDNRENFARFLTHAVELLIKMEPSESFPDIYLTFDSAEAQEFSPVFNNLERGKKLGSMELLKALEMEAREDICMVLELLKLMEVWKLKIVGLERGDMERLGGKKKHWSRFLIITTKEMMR